MAHEEQEKKIQESAKIAAAAFTPHIMADIRRIDDLMGTINGIDSSAASIECRVHMEARLQETTDRLHRTIQLRDDILRTVNTVTIPVTGRE